MLSVCTHSCMYVVVMSAMNNVAQYIVESFITKITLILQSIVTSYTANQLSSIAMYKIEPSGHGSSSVSSFSRIKRSSKSLSSSNSASTSAVEKNS